MKQFLTLGFLTVAAAAWLPAQRGMVNITPRITGGDSVNGKCIIRIMVDDTVNVRIGNGQIRVETLAGQPSRDDGTECSSVLRNGRNLSDFRFRGIDGRGEVRLQSDPRNDPRGEAVVYIRDSKGGDEGYTFEVSWSGDNGQFNNSGNGGFFGNRPGNNNGYNNGYNNGQYNSGNASYDRAVNSCMDRVRNQIQRDYRANNITFDNINTDNGNGRRDRVSGTARTDSGRRGDRFRFDCDVNLNNGNVRNVSISRN